MPARPIATAAREGQPDRLAPGAACSFDEDYSDPIAVEAFARALASVNDQNPYGNTPLTNTASIKALPDWAPVKQKTRKIPGLKSGSSRDVVREGWAYDLSRWPLLSLLFTLISLEFLGYILVRQLVNVVEWGFYWWGRKHRLRKALRLAPDYPSWKAAALKMDEWLGFHLWKRNAAYSYYDTALVKRVRDNLRQMRQNNDADGVRTVLEICLRSNFAGLESARLYSETYYGTKDLVEDYLNEVETSLQYIRTTTELNKDEKAAFFRQVSRHFGSTALCLSGGASFGYYHFGVVRALLDAGLLPRVMSGTSAGALLAALVCSRTDEELKKLVVPEIANKITACEDGFKIWSKRAWQTGARFDPVDWAKKASWFTLGSMTFREAYERTGRVLNVSVIPFETHSPTKLLNYLTAPDCVIFTACIASAAVPGILPPVVLLTKKPSGEISPWEYQGRHKDGSLRVDIPLQSLHLLFNCNFSIVSQVNPHISLFFFQPRGSPGRPVSHRKGKGWRGGFLLSAAEQYLKIELTKNFRVIRDLELMPEFGGQNWSSVFLQRFDGSVTIWPRARAKDWVRILTDPDPAELERMIDVGQRATWPKLHMIDNRMKIEKQIDKGREEARDVLRQSTGGRTAPLPTVDTDTALESEEERAPRKQLKSLSKSKIPANAQADQEDNATQLKRQEIMRKLGIRKGASESQNSSRKRGGQRNVQRRFSMGDMTGKSQDEASTTQHYSSAISSTESSDDEQ